MEALRLNLSRNDFTPAKKALLWIVGSMFLIGGLWSLYMLVVKQDSSIRPGLPVVLFLLSGFVFFVAALASFRKKKHFFHVDDDTISYRYGLISSRYRSCNWADIKKIIIKYNQRKAILILNNDKHILVNLNWIQKTSSQVILKHLYAASKNKGLAIARK
jgi:hypothetical protein